MKTEQIKLYKAFIEQAIKDYNCLLSKTGLEELNVDLFRSCYTIENFKEQFILFEKELCVNAEIYSDNSALVEYIKCYLSEIININYSSLSHTQEIIVLDFEVEISLTMQQCLRECKKAIEEIIEIDFSDFEYNNIDRYRKDIFADGYLSPADLITDSNSEVNGNSSVNLPKVVEKDSRFDFSQLKSELDVISDLIDKIKLVKRRMHELSAWEIQYDYMVYINDFDSQYFHSNNFYPNFRELCELEINHIEEEIKLEERRKKSTTQQPVVKTITLPRQKLQWTKSSREFVETFHNLIQNKKISLNGNHDLEPIARVLLETFDIPKGKGAGFVNEESMLTYFRKENAGDVY